MFNGFCSSPPLSTDSHEDREATDPKRSLRQTLLIHSMLHLLVHVVLKYLTTASPNSKPYTAPKLQTVNPKGYTLSLPSLGPQLETLHTKPKGLLQHAARVKTLRPQLSNPNYAPNSNPVSPKPSNALRRRASPGTPVTG